MKIQYTDANNERVYRLTDELLMNRTGLLEEEFNQFIQNSDFDLRLDLEEITRIDSMALASLIRVKKKLSEEDRNFSLTGANTAVIRILEMAGLDEYLMD
jgi:anti-anti-sigma factor